MSHLVSHWSKCLGAPALACAALVGCAAHHTPLGNDDATALAEDGTDTSATENDTETISSSFVASTGTLALASAGELAGSTLGAANIGDGVLGTYSPPGCLTVTSDASSRTADYVFDHCTGPYGLLDVSGSVKVTYAPQLSPATTGAPAGTRLTLDVVGTGLKVNRATADFTAHASIAAGALGARTMTWSARLSGTTARGREFTRQNTKTVVWSVGQECVRVNGSSDGDVTGRNVHTDLIDYFRCRGECPAAGSEVRITNVNSGRTVDIRYDGGHEATFTAPNGTQSAVTLACGL